MSYDQDEERQNRIGETALQSAYCDRCEADTPHCHVHDTAYGIADTHMGGTERYLCTTCGNVIFRDEGERKGLEFVFD